MFAGTLNCRKDIVYAMLFTDYVEWSRLLEIGPSKDPRTKASSTSSRMPTSDSEGNVSKIDYSLLKWW